MSLSSLPDIFRQTHSSHTHHRKQGGSFSLHLHSSSNSHLITRPNSTQNQRQYSTLQLTKQRSASSSAMRNKHSSTNDQNSRLLKTSRSRNQVGFKEGVQLLGDSLLKRGSGLAVMNISSVCYQTSRKFNNRMVDLEQAGSLKNNTLNSIKQMGLAEMQLEQVKRTVKQIKSSFGLFIGRAVEDMDVFHNQFGQALRLSYCNLSKLRRETNEQIRGNQKEVQKLNSELNVCKSVLTDMANNTQQLANQTIIVQHQPSTSNTHQQVCIDFEEISEIPKTSRGGTASITKRSRNNQYMPNDKRRSADWQIDELRGVAFD